MPLNKETNQSNQSQPMPSCFFLPLSICLIHLPLSLSLSIYIYIYISSPCRAIRTDISDPLLPHLHCFRQILWAKSRIGTELLYVGSSWTSYLYSSMWRDPQEEITYELVPTSPAVSRVSGSSNFDSFRDPIYQPLRSGRIWHKVKF